MAKERVSQPCWRYKNLFGKLRSKLFDHPDDVPAKEGWADSPAKVKGIKKPQAAAEADDAGADADG